MLYQGEAMFTNVAESAFGMSAVAKALSESPGSNPMSLQWLSTMGGKRVELPNGCLYVGMHDGFNDAASLMFCEAVKAAYRSKAPKIVIIIESYGGNVYSLMPMLDCIESVRLTESNPLGKPIVTICRGHVMSCGAVLWSAGDEGERYMVGKLSEVMIHPVSVQMTGRVSNPSLKTEAKQMDRLNDTLFNYMSKHLNIDVRQWLLEKGNNCELHISPEVARDPKATWGTADYTLVKRESAPIIMGALSDGDGVPELNFAVEASVNYNVRKPIPMSVEEVTKLMQEARAAPAEPPPSVTSASALRPRACAMPGMVLRNYDAAAIMAAAPPGTLAWNATDVI
jgi:ATP-dependent protease ClpP protease subunit